MMTSWTRRLYLRQDARHLETSPPGNHPQDRARLAPRVGIDEASLLVASHRPSFPQTGCPDGYLPTLPPRRALEAQPRLARGERPVAGQIREVELVLKITRRRSSGLPREQAQLDS